MTSQADFDRSVVELYRSGLTMMEVGEKIGVSEKTVHRALVRSGEPRRSRGGPGSGWWTKQPDSELILATYRAERTVSATCRALGIGRHIVNRVLLEEQEPRIPPASRVPIPEAIERYRAGETLQDLGARYGLHWSTVAQAFDRAGEPRRRDWSRAPRSTR